MKTATDPRHIQRKRIVQQLFAYSFSTRQSQPLQITPIIKCLTEVDAHIRSAAPQWPLEKIAKSDLAILRYALYELLHARVNPPKVIIDESIELAKEFGGDNSASFINGVLGTVVKKQNLIK